MTPLKDAASAKSYYEKDNYYAKDSQEAEKLSHWWGKGAQKLGLKGYVKVEVFEKLLEGKLPSGQQLGRIAEKNKVHRPGYDLTFSAPKSVSLLAEIGNDHRIYLAHDKAVEEAMSYIEKNAVETRSFRNGEIVFEKVNNIAVAMFRHDTSREQDPSTHTHCVVLNMIERQDGKWRSISSEALFDHKMVTGLIYRSQLAVELQKLGYDIEQTHDDGRFEIKGVSKEVIQHFSQRRQQIEERLEKEGWEGGKASAKVTLATRKRKVEVNRENLKETWQQRCTEIKFDHQHLIESAKIKSKQDNFKLKNPFLIAQDAIQYAAAHLGEREAVFPDRDLIREALTHALGKTTQEHIQKAIQNSREKGNLIAVNQDHWTTPEALKLEEDNIRLMKEGQEKCLPMSTPENVQKFIMSKEQEIGRSYTQGQRDAIRLILTNPDKVVGIQGSAGTGKTTLLKAIQEFIPQTNFELVGLAPTKNATLELQNKTNIPCMTLQKYLIDVAKGKKDFKQEKHLLIILDEASMVSSRQANQLLNVLSNPNVRLVMIGDIKQLAAIESGKPFYQLIKASMKIARMEEIVRQKSNILKDAIYDAIKGNISKAFQNIDVTEVQMKPKRLQNVVDEYLSYSKEGRERTLVLVPANEDRKVVNQGIREGLKREGILHGNEINTHILVSRNFSRTYRLRVTNYANGNIVRFNKNYSSLNVKAGEYWKILQIDREKNEMKLENLKNNKKIIWNPDQVGGKRDGAIEVYQQEERSLKAGDKIRWLRNLNDDIVNAQTAEIIRVQEQKAEVRLHNQKIVVLDFKQLENRHWDYAFAYTLHAKQGGENNRVIAHMESFRKKLSTQQAFYVAISRAEFGVRLIVDDRKECIKTIEKYTGEKLSALESLNKVSTTEKLQSEKISLKNETSFEQQYPIRQTGWKKPPNISRSSIKRWNVEDLQQRLSEQTEGLAKQLLGEPNHNLSSASELRYGKKGSLWIPINGKHVGGWRNFESGDKGNLIQLIQYGAGLNFKESLNYAGQFLRISPETNNVRKSKHSKVLATKEKSFELDFKDIIAIARATRLEQQSLSIEGTLAERYLREHRSIMGELPSSFRYHPRIPYYHTNNETKKISRKEYFPALICIAKNQQNKTQAVQVVYLDPKTANKALLDTPKRTYGRPSLGAAVMINPGKSKVLIAEGPETGLSVAQAYPEATVMVTLSASNFKNVHLKDKQKEVIMCLDNDGDNARSHKDALAAAELLTKSNHKVYLVKPDVIDHDFNDVLKLQGVDAVRTKIAEASLFQASLTNDYEPIFNSHLSISETKEKLDLSLNEQVEIEKFSEITEQFETQKLSDNEIEDLMKTTLKEKEIIAIDESINANLVSLESTLGNKKLHLVDEDFDIEL